jgi:HSP20 family protein
MEGIEPEKEAMMANLPDKRRERYFSPFDLAGYSMGRFLEDFLPASNGYDWAPPIDVSETKDAIEVRMEIPGICKEDVDVQVANGILTIKGEKKEVREEKEKRYHHREVRYGSFVRSVALPVDVRPDAASAECHDGILQIVLPKEEKAVHKKIEIKG